jgi:hypothetical protein
MILDMGVKEHKQEDARTNGLCWLNHIIGLPVKGRIEKPIFDYEKLLRWMMRILTHLA